MILGNDWYAFASKADLTVTLTHLKNSQHLSDHIWSVTLTSDLLTSKSDHYIFVPNCM